MNIVTSIMQSIHRALDPEGGEFPVYYHDDATLNVMTSRMEFPCAMVRLLTTGRLTMEAGQAKETVTAAVFFVDKSRFDFEAVENEQVIEVCRELASRWLLSLTSSDLEPVSEVRTSRVYDRFDDILTGFAVTLDLKEATGVCV